MNELDRLVPPRATVDFRERLRAEIEARERQSKGRRRIALLGALALAVAAGTGAGVRALGGPATRVVDRTALCTLPVRGGVPTFQLGGNLPGRAFYTGSWHPVPGRLAVGFGALAKTPIVEVSTAAKGYTFDQTGCAPTSSIALSGSALPAPTVIRRNDRLENLDDTCLVPGPVRIRIRVRLDEANAVIDARIAVRSRATPIAYAEWSPARLAYALSSDACRPRR
jgi:hypothetical protein